MLKKRLVIIGDGGLADEVAWLAETCGYEVVAHVVEQGFALKPCSTKSLSFLEELDKYDEVIFGIGSSHVKAKIQYQLFNIAWATLVSPKALIGKNCEIYPGAVVQAGVIITVNASIEKHVLLNLNVTVGHGSIIGECSTINPSANISGDVLIGKRSLIGTGAQVLEKRMMGMDSVLGAGAVLTKDLPQGKIAKGVPAIWL